VLEREERGVLRLDALPRVDRAACITRLRGEVACNQVGAGATAMRGERFVDLPARRADPG
jgi:hypothetical protein